MFGNAAGLLKRGLIHGVRDDLDCGRKPTRIKALKRRDGGNGDPWINAVGRKDRFSVNINQARATGPQLSRHPGRDDQHTRQAGL